MILIIAVQMGAILSLGRPSMELLQWISREILHVTIVSREYLGHMPILRQAQSPESTPLLKQLK